MASLENLPNELKDCIITHLSSRDVLSLSGTCRTLQVLARHVAYKDLTLTFSNTPDAEANAPSLWKLLHTLIKTPDLAESVKCLDFVGERCIHYDDLGDIKVVIPGGSVQLELISNDPYIDSNLTQKLHTPITALRGTESSHISSFDTTVALVLSCCANMEFLSISAAFLWHDEYPLHMDTPVLTVHSSPFLKNWRGVHVDFDLQVRSPSTIMRLWKRTLLFLHVPTLETLELTNLNEVEQTSVDWDEESAWEEFRTNIWPLDHAPMATHLTTLRLLFVSIKSEVLVGLLERTPKLHTFEFLATNDVSNYPVDLSMVKTALNFVQETLTSFTFRLDFSGNEDYDDPTDATEFLSDSIGSLRSYESITDLEISLHTLFGWNDSLDRIFYPLSAVLPPNLERLTITDDFYDFSPFDQYFEGIRAMAIFRRYLNGDILPDKWQEIDHDFRTRHEKVVWRKGRQTGEWQESTPKLKKFVYDLSNRGQYDCGYWTKLRFRNEFAVVCEEQGIEGKVLWNDDCEALYS